MISVGYAGRPFCSRQTLSALFRPILRRNEAAATLRSYRRGRVMVQLVRYPARRLRHEITPRLARPTNRPRLRISVRAAARELHDRSRAVLQWAEPPDAALLSDQQLGRAVQGGADARQVNLLPPQWKCCPTDAVDGCRPFRRHGPHPACARCDWTATGCAFSGAAIRASPVRTIMLVAGDEAACRAWAARQGFQLDVLDRDFPAFSDACRWIWARMSARSDQRRRLDRQACATAQSDHGGGPCIRSFVMNMGGSFRWCGRSTGRRLRSTQP